VHEKPIQRLSKFRAFRARARNAPVQFKCRGDVAVPVQEFEETRPARVALALRASNPDKPRRHADFIPRGLVELRSGADAWPQGLCHIGPRSFFVQVFVLEIGRAVRLQIAQNYTPQAANRRARLAL